MVVPIETVRKLPSVNTDAALTTAYFETLEASQVESDFNKRLIAYDPEEAPQVCMTGAGKFIKRHDARRAKKTTALAVDAPLPPTEVLQPFDPAKFNFTKINPKEVLFRGELEGGKYRIVTQKFPVAPCHLLLVAEEQRAQVLTRGDIESIRFFHQASTFNVVFNSSSAGSSVNHFHTHLTSSSLPVMALPLVRVPEVAEVCYVAAGHPALHLAFSSCDVGAVWKVVSTLQRDNVPHNILFTRQHTYIFPRHSNPERRGRSTPYKEIIGGFELTGLFTLYDEASYDSFGHAEHVATLNQVSMLPSDPAMATLFFAGRLAYDGRETAMQKRALLEDKRVCVPAEV